MIYGKNRVNNGIDNSDCDKDENIKRYTGKYIKIVGDKQVLIYSVSESVDELMEGLDVNTSNDVAIKEIKDFKRVVIKRIDKFNSFIKLEAKKKILKRKILKKKTLKRKVSKRKIPQKNISKR